MQTVQSLAVSLLMFSVPSGPLLLPIAFRPFRQDCTQSLLLAIFYRLRESISSGLPLFLTIGLLLFLRSRSYLRWSVFAKVSCVSGLVCPIPSGLLLLISLSNPFRQRCSLCQIIPKSLNPKPIFSDRSSTVAQLLQSLSAGLLLILTVSS